jgi:hypothetical protein
MTGYAPGYGAEMLDLLRARTAAEHAAYVAPGDERVEAAIDAHRRARTAAGGDPALGRRLPELTQAVGFDVVDVQARYECERPPHAIAAYLAPRVPDHADAVRSWPHRPGAVFAQCWVAVVARAPLGS